MSEVAKKPSVNDPNLLNMELKTLFVEYYVNNTRIGSMAVVCIYRINKAKKSINYGNILLVIKSVLSFYN